MMINLKKVWNDNPFDQWTEEELLCMEEQGICYGKGSSSPPPPPAVQTTTQTSEFPTELRPFISDIFEKGQAIQEQRQAEGFQPELTQQLAPFTPDQQQAFEGIRQQVGQTRPLFEEATTLARDATRAATDPTEIAALMNPFLRNVVDIEKREAERIADVQEQQLGARAAQAGAFGGSRAAVLEAERQRNLNQQLGDIESRGLATAFQDAQNRLQSQFGREAAGATQLSALGTAIPAQTFKELGALSGVGAAEQQQDQRALDIATQQAREEFGFPQQTLQDFSSILRGFPLPATQNFSRSTFSPAQPLSTQLLGLGTGLAGLAGAAGAFKKAGGRVGAPVGLKNGGYVKLAGGGGLGEMMQGEVQRYQEGGRTQVEILSRLSIEELKDLINNPTKAAELGLSSVLVQRALDDKTARPADLQLSAVKEAARDVGTGDIATLMGEQVTMYDTKSGQMSNRTVPQLTSPLQSLPPEQQLQKQIARNPAIVEAGVDDVSIIEKMRASSPYAGAISKDPFKGFTGTIPKPDLGTPTSMAEAQQKFPFKIPPRVDRTSDVQRELDAGMLPMQSLPATPADFGPTSTVIGGSYDPVPRGSAQRVTAPPPPAPSALPSSFSSIPVPTTGYGSLEDMRKAATFQPSLLSGDPITRANQVASGYRKAAGLDPDSVGAGIVEREEDFLTEKFTGTGSPPQDGIAAQLEEAMKSVNPKGPFIDEKVVTKAVDVKKGPDGGVAAKKSPDGGVAAEVSSLQVDESDPDGQRTAILQSDYDQQVSDIKSRDYADDIKAMLGDAPTYEKGEEPDFAARKWLALANFGAGLLASGGSKTLAQSVGEAAKPALKELAQISREERKIKGELRKERNAQKREAYQDKLKRFDLQRKLKNDDLNMYQKTAQVKLAFENNQISKDKLDQEIKNSLVDNNYKRIKTQVDEYKLEKDKDGFMSLNDAQRAWGKLEKAALTSAIQQAKALSSGYPMKAMTQADISALVDTNLNALRPSFIRRLGNSIKVGDRVLTQAEVFERFGPVTPAAPPKPGTTVNVTGQGGATVTMRGPSK